MHFFSPFGHSHIGHRRGFPFGGLMAAIAVVGFFGAIVAAVMSNVDYRGYGGPVAGAFHDGPNEAIRAAESLGFSGVRILDTDYTAPEFAGCGEDDGVAYDVTAKNQLEHDVRLTVCCGGPGSLKDCTVRAR